MAESARFCLLLSRLRDTYCLKNDYSERWIHWLTGVVTVTEQEEANGQSLTWSDRVLLSVCSRVKTKHGEHVEFFKWKLVGGLHMIHYSLTSRCFLVPSHLLFLLFEFRPFFNLHFYIISCCISYLIYFMHSVERFELPFIKHVQHKLSLIFNPPPLHLQPHVLNLMLCDGAKDSFTFNIGGLVLPV